LTNVIREIKHGFFGSTRNWNRTTCQKLVEFVTEKDEKVENRMHQGKLRIFNPIRIGFTPDFNDHNTVGRIRESPRLQKFMQGFGQE